MAPICVRLGSFDLLKNSRMTRALVSVAFLVRSGGARAHFSSQHGLFWRLERFIFVPPAPSVRSLQNIGRSYDLALRIFCATRQNPPKIVAMRACTPTHVQDDQLGPQKRHRGSQDARLAAQDGFRGAQDGALGALGGVPNVPRSVPRTTLGAPRPPRSISGCDFGRLGRPRPRFWHASWTVLATCDPPCRSFGETCAATMHAPLHQRCTKVSAPSPFEYS